MSNERQGIALKLTNLLTGRSPNCLKLNDHLDCDRLDCMTKIE